MIKRFLWKMLGFICLGMAYVGVITPGLPYSPFVVAAAYCFGKGSPRMHAWIYNHKLFGPFLTNWSEKRVFPLKMKFFMVFMMSTSLITMWFTTGNLAAIGYTASFMACVVIWAWKYPSTTQEYDRRKSAGVKISWFR